MTEKNNVIKAINKNVRSGARKANLVLNFIKGKKADVAIKDLEFTRKKVAMDISDSESALKGGDLGWIRENTISKQFRSEIINTPVGNVTKAIILPEGVLYLKVRDKRELKRFENLEDAKNQLVDDEKSKILNMHSLSHYDNLKRTITIQYYQMSEESDNFCEECKNKQLRQIIERLVEKLVRVRSLGIKESIQKLQSL